MGKRQKIIRIAGDMLKGIGILAGGGILGALLLAAVYLLPVSPMKENVARSSAVFDYEGVYPQLVQGYKSSQLDNCTDAIMLGIAAYSEEPAEKIRKAAALAMDARRVEFRGDDPVRSLNDYVNEVEGKEKQKQVVGYTRYWHGYLIPLKLLLLFFDYGDIRFLNLFIQFFLTGWIMILMVEKGRKRLLLPFAVLICVLNPVAEAMSLQFSSVYYITLLSLLGILRREKMAGYAARFFFCIGMMTSFLDLLTYPLLTLGVPLVLMFLLFEGRMGEKLLLLVKACCAWGLGYAGMWGGKWLIASVLLQRNIFSDAYQQALLRSSMQSDGSALRWGEVIWRNVRVLLRWPYLFLAAAVGIILLKKIWSAGLKGRVRRAFLFGIPFFLIALMPFVWFCALGNHSYQHYWFTYRELGITCFALLVYLAELPHFLKKKPKVRPK